ncbi:MAG: DUF4398 domain-containing protein [Nitrosomonas sp.]|nr:DUF4398 domain-containing protein [Nitrosomonas sp.]
MDQKMMKNFYSLNSYPMIRIFNITVICAIFMVGCESIPAPTEQIATSRTSVNNALSAGGSEFAPVEFKSAMEKMEAAERAMGEKDYVLARQLAEQAQMDAQLAGAMARTAKAQKAADALQEASHTLRQEIDRQVQ